MKQVSLNESHKMVSIFDHTFKRAKFSLNRSKSEDVYKTHKTNFYTYANNISVTLKCQCKQTSISMTLNLCDFLPLYKPSGHTRLKNKNENNST